MYDIAVGCMIGCIIVISIHAIFTVLSIVKLRICSESSEKMMKKFDNLCCFIFEMMALFFVAFCLFAAVLALYNMFI